MQPGSIVSLYLEYVYFRRNRKLNFEACRFVIESSYGHINFYFLTISVYHSIIQNTKLCVISNFRNGKQMDRLPFYFTLSHIQKL